VRTAQVWKMPALTCVKVCATEHWVTVRVKLCVASGGTPLPAVKVSGYGPAVPGPGVPLRVAVPSPLSVKLTPSGRTPVLEIVSTGGQPLVVTVNDARMSTVKVVWSALVKTGAWGPPTL